MIEFCPAPVHFTGAVFVCVPEEILKKKAPKSGHVDEPRNSPTTAPLRPTTPKRASGNERALKKGGAGGHPPRLFASGLSLEKAWIPRPGPGGEPPRRAHPAMVLTGPPADGRPLNSPAIIPESRPDDNQRERLACRKQARPAVSGLLKKCILEISIGSALCYPGDSSPGGIFLGPIA